MIWGGFEAILEIGPQDDEYGHYLEMPVSSLEGIELYGSAREAPVGVRPLDGGCGVIVLWPRRAGVS